jgi:monoamine oxidase
VARAAIAHLKCAPAQREAKILAVMQGPPWRHARRFGGARFDDVPPSLWPVAKRSLLAHVARIEASL